MSAELTSSDFPAFYRAVNKGFAPFPWQERLAKMACEGAWPRTIDLPTGSGKTSCIDIAVFAMAVRGRGPRRIFFVVDRRVVVDQAFDHMQEIAAALRGAHEGVLQKVADRLRGMGASETDPVTAYQMRGGIYRDDSWVRSPLQPMLIASTVDQVGSRLLFRGYGAGDHTCSMHAALTANDALILLDEAHCSRAFAQTLDRVERYRGNEWAATDLGLPFGFVEMTATPFRETADPFRLEGEDYSHPVLRTRLFASKPATLVISKARLKDTRKLAEDLVNEAVGLSKQPGLRRIAVMVNRVRTARDVYSMLQKAGYRSHLLIGRMRPVDRAELDPDIDAMRSGTPRQDEGEPVFIAATQCLEVGADLDFDALVTECASIDSLLQRFGRLDRTGYLRGAAQGRIVIATPMTETKYRDPVYGDALSRTWQWLAQEGQQCDFGICANGNGKTVRERLQEFSGAEELRRTSPHAPILLPSHLDAFAQTSPRPTPDPDPRYFLHGNESSSPDVQVVWRADLDTMHPELWADTVALCPPVSAEAMAVPLVEFRRWLTEPDDNENIASDLEGTEPEERESGKKRQRGIRCPVLRWSGDESVLPRDARQIRPGDTLILAKNSEGWNDLGHIPPGRPIDMAERARHSLRRGWTLRLSPSLLADEKDRWPDTDRRTVLLAMAKDADAEKNGVTEALKEYRKDLPDDYWLSRLIDEMTQKIRMEAYPAPEGAHAGWVLDGLYAEADSGQDEGSAFRAITLEEHLADVTEDVQTLTFSLIGDEKVKNSMTAAAKFHDCGKADARFQALLHGGDPMAVQFAPALLAKGKQSRPSPQVRRAQRERSGLPKGFRHELISLSLLRQNGGLEEDELALHLVASHHGRCRPFAPVVGGESVVFWNGWTLSIEQAKEMACYRLDSGVAERFWRLTRTYGWWGLAYLETLLRLADWKASTREAS